MSQLTEEKCTACRVDSPHVTDSEINQLHPEIPEWKLIEEAGIRKLERGFRFPNFVKARAFTNGIGDLAETEGHHPRLTTEWGRVTITWWTHKIRDLHHNDFIMAAKTDRLYGEVSQSS